MVTACLGCGSWLQENHWKPDEIPRCFKCEAHALRAEVERLTEENAALRELVPEAYGEGKSDGVDEANEWGIEPRNWNASASKQRLEQIGKGEG